MAPRLASLAFSLPCCCFLATDCPGAVGFLLPFIPLCGLKEISIKQSGWVNAPSYGGMCHPGGGGGGEETPIYKLLGIR